MKRFKRKRVFADWKIQGGLCIRVCIYWIACLSTTVITILGFACLEGPTASSSSISRYIVPAMIAAMLVLPLVLLDLLVFTNRFAGPLLNFRRRFNDLAEGKETEEIRFRTGDFMIDISDNYNKVREQLVQKELQFDVQNAEYEKKETAEIGA